MKQQCSVSSGPIFDPTLLALSLPDTESPCYCHYLSMFTATDMYSCFHRTKHYSRIATFLYACIPAGTNIKCNLEMGSGKYLNLVPIFVAIWTFFNGGTEHDILTDRVEKRSKV